MGTLLGLRWVIPCLFLLFGPPLHAVWVEDFKTGHLGFDHPWEQPTIVIGRGTTQFISDGEVAQLSLRSDDAYRCTVDLAGSIPWNSNENRYIQLRISRLSPEARLKVYALSDVDGRQPHLLMNKKNGEEILGDELLLIDAKGKIPAGVDYITLRLELDKDNLRAAPSFVEVYIDWIKAGLPDVEAFVEAAPGHVGPADGGECATARPRLEWTAPAGQDATHYTVSLSRDPCFAAANTTLLDGVAATHYDLPRDLEPGRWYWTVSATDDNGFSGPLLQHPTENKPYSFVIPGTPDRNRELPHFNVRAGSQGMATLKKFTDEPKLVEQARRMLEMGSEAYKFLMGSDTETANYVLGYRDMSDEIRHKSHTLVELIQNEPAYKTVLDMPFTYFLIWAYPMDLDVSLGKITPEVAAAEYQQIYDLTRYLLQTYEGTGKVFLLGHWEGDNAMLSGQDGMTGVPSPEVMDQMRIWLQNRQKAVEDGRASLPEIQGAEVYHYAEITSISPVLDAGLPRMITHVLPELTVDLVSYSAYNGTNLTDELPDRLWMHLDYILGHANFTGAWKRGKPVFVGEYGLPLGIEPRRAPSNLISLKSAASWGCPFVLFWSVYTNESHDSSSLINLEGEKTREYHDIADYIAKMHLIKHASRVWLGRNPSELEGNRLALDFDAWRPHELLRRIIDSLEYRVLVDDASFLKEVFAGCGIDTEKHTAFFNETLGRLQRDEATRFETLLAVLDSGAFAEAVPDAQFQAYLTGRMMAGEDELARGAGESRSQQYLRAIDSEGFRKDDIQPGRDNRVTEQLEAKYKPRFAFVGEGR